MLFYQCKARSVTERVNGGSKRRSLVHRTGKAKMENGKLKRGNFKCQIKT